jgi:hypothetical protein
MWDNKKEIFAALREYENINKKVVKLTYKLDEFEKHLDNLEEP